MYLFDTDILSWLAKKRRPEGLMPRLAATPVAAQFTTAVNVAEIYHGIFRLEVEDGTSRESSGVLRPAGFSRVSTILPFERDDARAYGQLRASLERKGRPRFEPDLQIAAIARIQWLIMVTGNVRHFEGIPGLKVENWLA